MFVILLRHIEHIGAIGHKHIPAFLVVRHVLRLAFLEHIEFRIVVTLDPAGFIHLQRLPFAFRLILVLEAVLNDLELELSHPSTGSHLSPTVSASSDRRCQCI